MTGMPGGFQRPPARRAPSPSSGEWREEQMRNERMVWGRAEAPRDEGPALRNHPVFEPEQDSFDRARADLGVEHLERRAATEGPIVATQPERGFLERAEDLGRMRDHARESDQPIAFVGIEDTLRFPSRK